MEVVELPLEFLLMDGLVSDDDADVLEADIGDVYVNCDVNDDIGYDFMMIWNTITRLHDYFHQLHMKCRFLWQRFWPKRLYPPHENTE